MGVLDRAGYSVRTFDSAVDVLVEFERVHTDVVITDVVITDIIMPKT